MLIFLDSNIICADYKMKSPSFEVAQKVGTIVLGQIVVDEVCNKYRENLEEKATKTRKAILELNDPLLTPHTFGTNWTFRMNVANIKISWKCLLLKAA